MTSRIRGFHRLPLVERRRALATAVGLPPGDVHALAADGLSAELADGMVENAVGTFSLPFGVALNFQVNGRDVVVPLVVEEPSVIAAASSAALLARAGGGFTADADDGVMIGQIQLVDVADGLAAVERLWRARPALLDAARALTPGLCGRGAGPRDLEVRLLRGPNEAPMVVVHVLVDTGDAMGANAVNSLVEGLSPLIEEVGRGRACLRILSNLADRRLARAKVAIPCGALARGDLDGDAVAARIVQAWDLAAVDPYRAATHNKGVMNGVDAVALATGNDWRAIEAGAHAFACLGGAYRPLTTWAVADGALTGSIELPMAVSTVGPLAASHPRVRTALRILGSPNARELGGIMAAVGLASNLAALRALVTDGIQAGHMALHARAVCHAAGARGAQAEELQQRLVAGGEVKLERARQLLTAMARSD
jgi:hydroxymethylglutaryl-CoA reductase